MAGQYHPEPRVILIEEHRPGQFHVKSFFSLDRRFRDTVLAWRENTFSIGGPDELSQVSSTDIDHASEATTEVSTIDNARGSFLFAEYFYLTEGDMTY